jgi:DNA-binding transcriptional LysR family regulator
MYDWAEFRHFRYLLAILEKGGFRVAADELHTSQPNLTVQARQFQENASIRLFRKSKNGRIYPTRTGLAFLALAPLLLEVRDEIMDALVAIERGEINSVRFRSTPLVDQSLFRTADSSGLWPSSGARCLPGGIRKRVARVRCSSRYGSTRQESTIRCRCQRSCPVLGLGHRSNLCGLHKELMPKCAIRPTHGDAAQLAEEVVDGMVDAAIVTLPLKHPALHIAGIRSDRLVVCLRRDHSLASKAALEARDLQSNLAVLYHPQRHPDAHQRLLELLADAGVTIEEYSRASHPSEMQTLVKDGYGFA